MSSKVKRAPLVEQLEDILKNDKDEESTPEVLKDDTSSNSSSDSDSESDSGSESDGGKPAKQSEPEQSKPRPKVKRSKPKPSEEEYHVVTPEMEAEIAKLRRWLATKRYAYIVRPYKKQIEKLVKTPGEAGIDQLKFMTKLLRDKTGVNSDVSPDDAADTLLKGVLPPILELLKMAGYDYTCFLPEWQKTLPNHLTLALIEYPINTGGVNPIFPLVAAVAAPIAIKTWNDMMKEQAKAALEEKIRASQRGHPEPCQAGDGSGNPAKAATPAGPKEGPRTLLPGQPIPQEPKPVEKPPLMTLDEMKRLYDDANKV